MIAPVQARTPPRRYLRMAVLSESVEGAHAPIQPRVLVSAGNLKVRQRIVTALRKGSLQPSLQVDTSSKLFGLATGSSAIIVLTCDVNQSREMAALRRVRRELREPAVVAISPTTTGTGVRRALDAGADAIVFESDLEATLAATVSAVATGQSVVPRKLRASVQRPVLSHRERQVLSQVSEGLTNAQIAEQLFLSESTIKSHLSSAFTKLGVRSRREAAALFHSLENPSPPQAVT